MIRGRGSVKPQHRLIHFIHVIHLKKLVRDLPIHTAASPADRLSSTLTPAVAIAPLFDRLTVSSAKAEKVVKPPRMPVKRKARASGPISPRASATPASRPMTR